LSKADIASAQGERSAVGQRGEVSRHVCLIGIGEVRRDLRERTARSRDEMQRMPKTYDARMFLGRKTGGDDQRSTKMPFRTSQPARDVAHRRRSSRPTNELQRDRGKISRARIAVFGELLPQHADERRENPFALMRSGGSTKQITKLPGDRCRGKAPIEQFASGEASEPPSCL
jgi:hypothetical protein